MDSRYATVYADLYRRHWWWRAREAAVVATIQELALPRPAQILDVGCGDALFFDRLEEFGAVEGLEVDASLVSAETRQTRRVFVQPFDAAFDPGKRYDLILMLDVLEHVPDPEAALRHATHLLEPGGYLLVTVPALRWLWTSHDDFNQHRTRYHRDELGQELRHAGLAVEALRFLFLWPVVGKIGVKLKEKLHLTPLGPLRCHLGGSTGRSCG